MTVYRSILQKRNVPALRDDFAGLQTLSFFDKKMPDNGDLHWWNRYIPLMPADFESIFLRNFSDSIRINLELSSEEGTVFVLSHPPGKFKGEIGIVFKELEFMAAPHSQFDVQKDFRGQGIGKNWLRSCAEFAAARGYQKFRFYAGNENGACVWAHMQIPLDMAENEKEMREISAKEYAYKLESIRPYLDKSHYESARVLCRMENADDMIHLAQDTRPVSNDLFEALWEPASEIYKSLYAQHTESPIFNAKPREVALNSIKHMSAVFNEASAANRDVTLSSLLGAHGLWPAIIDFTDAQRMEIIGRKLGGWRTIEPV